MFYLRIIQRVVIINMQILHLKFPLFMSDFNEKLISSTHFRKMPKYKIERKSVQWESICRLIGKTKLIDVLPNSGNPPENNIICFVSVRNVISYFKETTNIANVAHRTDRENRRVVHFQVGRCPVAECNHVPQSN